jgi:hypothetical protein
VVTIAVAVMLQTYILRKNTRNVIDEVEITRSNAGLDTLTI